jgi:hypothetical protein
MLYDFIQDKQPNSNAAWLSVGTHPGPPVQNSHQGGGGAERPEMTSFESCETATGTAGTSLNNSDLT